MEKFEKPKKKKLLGPLLAAGIATAAGMGSEKTEAAEFNGDFPTHHYQIEGKGRNLGEALQDLDKQIPKLEEQRARDLLKDYGLGSYEDAMKKIKGH
jgi:hypothetical protein